MSGIGDNGKIGRLALRNRRVLVVEDEALVSLLVVDTLLSGGAEIIGPAASIETALTLIEAAMSNGGIDAAVLDLNLRGVSSLPVADRLAALVVPYLITTGYGFDSDLGAHSAAPRLVKPFDLDQLILALAELMNAGRREDANFTL